METFLSHIASFPTAIFSTALVVVVGYWLLALLGTFDIDLFDAAIDADIEIDSDVSEVGRIGGLLTTLGLTGVPITIVLSLLILNGWIISYFVNLILPGLLMGFLPIKILIGMITLALSLGLSILATASMVKPLRGLFRKLNQAPKSVSLIGRTCRIRSSRADNHFGEAECQLEGASLIVKVRTSGDRSFSTGASVVLTEHNKDTDSFIVVSEEEFRQELN